MFSVQQIRAKARQTIAETPGAYLIALIPVIMGVLINLMTSSESNNLVLQLINNPVPSPSHIINATAFPFLYGILVDLMGLSISFALFQIIYKLREKVQAKDAFTIFNHQRFGSILATYLVKAILLFLWGLVATIGLSVMLGGAILSLVATISTPAPQENLLVIAGFMMIIGLLVMIAGIALFLPQFFAYFLVEPLLFDQLTHNTYTGPMAVIKESRRLMKGYKMQGFVLNLSFIGWYILTFISFGIVGIYVIPYYHTSHIYFYQAVLDDRAIKEKFVQSMMP